MPKASGGDHEGVSALGCVGFSQEVCVCTRVCASVHVCAHLCICVHLLSLQKFRFPVSLFIVISAISMLAP